MKKKHRRQCVLCNDRAQTNVAFTYRNPKGVFMYVCLACREVATEETYKKMDAMDNPHPPGFTGTYRKGPETASDI